MIHSSSVHDYLRDLSVVFLAAAAAFLAGAFLAPTTRLAGAFFLAAIVFLAAAVVFLAGARLVVAADFFAGAFLAAAFPTFFVAGFFAAVLATAAFLAAAFVPVVGAALVLVAAFFVVGVFLPFFTGGAAGAVVDLRLAAFPNKSAADIAPDVDGPANIEYTSV